MLHYLPKFPELKSIKKSQNYSRAHFFFYSDCIPKCDKICYELVMFHTSKIIAALADLVEFQLRISGNVALPLHAYRIKVD